MNYYKKVKPYRITLKAPDNATDIAKIQKKKKRFQWAKEMETAIWNYWHTTCQIEFSRYLTKRYMYWNKKCGNLTRNLSAESIQINSPCRIWWHEWISGKARKTNLWTIRTRYWWLAKNTVFTSRQLGN